MSVSSAIFIVEDDDGHAHLIERNLRESGIANDIVRFSNGHAVLKSLFGDHGRVDPPLLMFLDLNMPGASGRDVLRQMRLDPRTRSTPVVVLSTGLAEEEIHSCYELGCNLYLNKPVQYVEFARVLQTTAMALREVQLPNGRLWTEATP